MSKCHIVGNTCRGFIMFFISSSCISLIYEYCFYSGNTALCPSSVVRNEYYISEYCFYIGNTALCPSSVVQYAKQDNEILTQSGDSCYTVVPHRVSWSHAETICNNRGGHLFHVTDSGQNLFIYILLNTHFNHSVWMGLHDHRQEEHFEWTSGIISFWSCIYSI